MKIKKKNANQVFLTDTKYRDLNITLRIQCCKL